jgi:hypothetical protein
VTLVMIDMERGREILNVGRRFALALPDRVLPKLGAKATRDGFVAIETCLSKATA